MSGILGSVTRRFAASATSPVSLRYTVEEQEATLLSRCCQQRP
jgi:hypothetical protein